MYGESEQILYDVAKLYYNENLTQSEISSKLQLSRPKVSRLLAKAREQKIVEIYIKEPYTNNNSLLEQKFKTIFGLKNILVVTSPSSDELLNLQYVAKYAAQFFSDLLKDGDCIGVAWGYTLLEIARNLPAIKLNQSKIVQITGNLDNADTMNFAHDIIKQFSLKLNSNGAYTLPCPVIVESKIIVDLLLHDSKISHKMEMAQKANKILVNISVLNETNCLYKTNYISSKELEQLRDANSVGSICSHFIDKNGELTSTELDERTISISLDTLKNAENVCVCVCSFKKIPALLGALRGKLVNSLVIDSNTAIQLFELYN